MALSASALRKLASLALSSEQLAGVIDVLADLVECEEERKAKQRDRKQRQRAGKEGQSRDSHGTVTGQERDSHGDKKGDKEKSPQTPLKEINQKNNPPIVPPEGTESKTLFSEFWAVYPDRNVLKPKKPAWQKWVTKLKAGADPRAIIAGAIAYGAEMRRAGKFGTEFVQQPSFWLNQERWQDYADAASPTGDLFVASSSENFHPLRVRYRSERKADPPDAVHGGEAGAMFPAQWVINSRQVQHAAG